MNNFYSGNIHVPHSMGDEVLYVWGSTFFTRFGLTGYVKHTTEDINDHHLLKKYKTILNKYDEECLNYLDKSIERLKIENNKEKIITEIWQSGKSFTTCSVIAMVETSDGLVYIRRGKNVAGSGDISITLTGILEHSDIKKTLYQELEEELNINISKVIKSKNVGFSFIDQGREYRGRHYFGLVSSILFNVKLDISFNELKLISKTAKDSYENENIYLYKINNNKDKVDFVDNIIKGESKVNVTLQIFDDLYKEKYLR